MNEEYLQSVQKFEEYETKIIGQLNNSSCTLSDCDIIWNEIKGNDFQDVVDVLLFSEQLPEDINNRYGNLWFTLAKKIFELGDHDKAKEVIKTIDEYWNSEFKKQSNVVEKLDELLDLINKTGIRPEPVPVPQKEAERQRQAETVQQCQAAAEAAAEKAEQERVEATKAAERANIAAAEATKATSVEIAKDAADGANGAARKAFVARDAAVEAAKNAENVAAKVSTDIIKIAANKARVAAKAAQDAATRADKYAKAATNAVEAKAEAETVRQWQAAAEAAAEKAEQELVEATKAAERANIAAAKATKATSVKIAKDAADGANGAARKAFVARDAAVEAAKNAATRADKYAKAATNAVEAKAEAERKRKGGKLKFDIKRILPIVAVLAVVLVICFFIFKPASKEVSVSFAVPEGTKVVFDGKDVSGQKEIKAAAGTHDIKLNHPLLDFDYDKKINVSKQGGSVVIKNIKPGANLKAAAEKANLAMMSDILQQACTSDSMQFSPSVFSANADQNGMIKKFHNGIHSYATSKKIKSFLPVAIEYSANPVIEFDGKSVFVKQDGICIFTVAGGHKASYSISSKFIIQNGNILVVSLDKYKNETK